MAGLPDILLYSHVGQSHAVLHGAATRKNRFLWAVSAEEEFAEEIDALTAIVGKVDVVLAGHSWIAFRRVLGSVDWINPGVIGMPAHDGTQRGWFAMLSPGRPPEFHPVIYNADAAAASMIRARLLQGCHQSLLSGYWPSEDILPAGLRRGEALLRLASGASELKPRHFADSCVPRLTQALRRVFAALKRRIDGYPALQNIDDATANHPLPLKHTSCREGAAGR